MRGIAVNFVPLAGSVFAAAVVTNKDRGAVTYWNLGLDGCRDPIPSWPLTATYSGPVIPIEPIVEPVSTLAFKYADSSGGVWGSRSTPFLVTQYCQGMAIRSSGTWSARRHSRSRRPGRVADRRVRHGAYRDRTGDLLVANQALSQLS